MSGRLVSVAAALAALVLSSSVTSAEKPKAPPRVPLQITKMSYVITHNGEKKGYENIVQTEYSDNTVVFDVDADFGPVPDVSIQQDVDLTLQDESYFPMKYRQERHVRQKDSGTDVTVEVEMFSNVAVIRTSTPNSSSSRNVVVPTGAAFLETGVVYPYYQLLYWYDKDRGRRQNFDALDIGKSVPSTVGVQFVAHDTVSVNGAEVSADLYVVSRDQYDVKLYVGADGRIVRVDQNMLLFDLVDWSREDLRKDDAATSG